MFDIGFTELLVIAVVALVVIGPEKLPGAIRTGSVWVGRLKRSYQDIKREVELEIHNSEVLEKLQRAEAEIKEQINPGIQSLIEDSAEAARTPGSESPTEASAKKSQTLGDESPAEPSAKTPQTPGDESNRNE
ncbi:MAG: Sec-independent protein translocase protein TatB [Proteobacteria bacterium]|nr:Sec-independent protein translocase protein TatB [Pseudomonadota bacterium]